MSAQTDRFVHDRLPPREQWPQLRYDLPELQLAGRSCNLVEELLDQAPAKGWGDRPAAALAAHHPDLRRRARPRRPHLPRAGRRPGPGARQPRAAARRQLHRPGAGLAGGGQGRRRRGGHHAAAARARAGRHHRQGAARRWRCATSSCWRNWSWRARTARCCATVVPFNAPERARLAGGARRRRRTATSPPAPRPPTTSRMLAFTSGTTGKPKAAVHTHRDVLAACEAWPRHVLRRRRTTSWSAAPPLAFTFGLGGLLVFPMWAGASVYFPDAPYTPEIAGAHHQRGRRDHLLHRADLLPPDGAVRARARRGQAAHLRQRRRRPARRHPAAVEAGQRHRDAGRHRRHRDVPHLHLLGRRRGAARRHRQGGAGLHGQGGGRRGQRSAARHHRQAGRDRPDRLQVPGRRRARPTT